jgi:hypothetical protein
VAKRVTITFLVDDEARTDENFRDELHDAVQDAQMPYNDNAAADIDIDVQEGVTG